MLRTIIYNTEEKSVDKKITIDINVPFHEDIEELAYIKIRPHSLPRNKESDFISFLKNTISEYNLEYYDEKTSELVENFKSNAVDSEDLVKKWEKLLREETTEYADSRCESENELFAAAYHKLVHSPVLEAIFQVEHLNTYAIEKRFDERTEQMKILTDRQRVEMRSALDKLDNGVTEDEINELSQEQYYEHSICQIQLTSKLQTIKDVQRRAYRAWTMHMLEYMQGNSSTSQKPFSPVLFERPPSTGQSVKPIIPTILEESFTIHLGSQLKQMHNIRILSCNILDLCRRNTSGEICPQLLQTALALYSSDLCGLVLMTDNVATSTCTKDFMKICETSTEYHFKDIDIQLEKIAETNKKYVKAIGRTSKFLMLGDVYITKHSNLSQVHVVFHMVSDDSVEGDMNSRHPVLLGLRNILKAACANDVTCITIPLLLQNEMSEEMTVLWCTKRAELVFKCVKGFMIEMASWGGSDLKTVQFLIPEGISSDVFHSLTTMLPSIFKVSTPLVLSDFSTSSLRK